MRRSHTIYCKSRSYLRVFLISFGPFFLQNSQNLFIDGVVFPALLDKFCQHGLSGLKLTTLQMPRLFQL